MTDFNSPEYKAFAARASRPDQQIFLVSVLLGTLAQKLRLPGVIVDDQLVAVRSGFESYPFIRLAPGFMDEVATAAHDSPQAVEAVTRRLHVDDSGVMTLKAA